MEKFYLTTAIDYVNATPHIGHAYEKIAADIIARYFRLRGKDVFFLTGVDEHGLKVEQAAQSAGKSPQDFCDEMSAKFQEAWRQLFISHNYFIRTTEEKHVRVVQDLFTRMLTKGDIYLDKYSGLYCEGCEDYLRDRDLDSDGNCPNHKKQPLILEEENYFFRLTRYKDTLQKWLTTAPYPLKPEGRRHEVLNQLADDELGDFSISRSRSSLAWGIPVPNASDQVIYVWVDALINYVSGAGYLSDESSWQRYWPADLHIVGKDITKFHAIYWPAMLLSSDLPLPRLVFGHGFITVEGQKMSKTLGNVIDPVYLVNRYGADAIRYFLFANNSFAQDGDFSIFDFVNKVNSHLANNLGNLLNRTLTLVERNCHGKVPTADIDPGLIQVAYKASEQYQQYMEQLEIARAIECIFAMVGEANKYLNEEKPWSAFKEGNSQRVTTVLLSVLELLKYSAILLYPVTPNLASNIWYQLGFDNKLENLYLTDTCQTLIPYAQPIRNTGPVFQRIEEATPASSKA